jgi:hypothetical protein
VVETSQVASWRPSMPGRPGEVLLADDGERFGVGTLALPEVQPAELVELLAPPRKLLEASDKLGFTTGQEEAAALLYRAGEDRLFKRFSCPGAPGPPCTSSRPGSSRTRRWRSPNRRGRGVEFRGV